MASDDTNKQIGSLTGILNWSLQHNDGTQPPKAVSEADRKFFFDAMAAASVDPVKRMQTITAEVASNPQASLSDQDLDARVALFEELRDHVEDLDAACDLSKVGGLPPMVATVQGSQHAVLRALAAEVLATCVQNNPKAQQQLLDAGVLDTVLQAARDDVDGGVRLKAWFAVSALVRHCPPAQAAFRLGDGFGLLKRAACDDAQPKIQRRALLLARHLATSHPLHLESMVHLGYVRAGAASLASRSGDVRQAGLGLLLDIARHVDFEKLPQAVDDFRHPVLADRLAAVRSALAAAGAPGEEDADAEERELADQLAAMLGVPSGGRDAR